MDLSKAFDCVDHSILLQRLQSYGVRGNVLQLFKSYLSNRKQATDIVTICNHTRTEITKRSSYTTVKYGVPQGSVLGPLLFILYINELPDTVDNQMVLYADDSTIIFPGNNNDNNNYESDINKSMTNIIQYLNQINLIINIPKTKLMQFQNRHDTKLSLDIYHENEKINEVDSTKFLGLYIDKNLNWKTHIEDLTKRVSQFSYALFMLSRIVDRKTVLLSYHAHVAAILRYGVIFWGNGSESNTVFKAQKKCVRAMFNVRIPNSCQPFFKQNNILTMPCIYIYEISLFVKKNNTMFGKLKSNRHQDRICVPPRRTAFYNSNVLGMCPVIYNALPAKIRKIQLLQEFKQQLKDFLLQKCYYSVSEFLVDISK